MKVLMINTHDNHGGAAVACQRLISALLRYSDIEINLLCINKDTHDSKTASIGSNINLYLEKFHFLFFEKSKKKRFAFSSAKFGINISNHPWVKESDIIHLHWINLGFLSVKGIDTLLNLNKPIFWTLHDMWAFTGGCHQSNSCHNYQKECGNCIQFLRKPFKNDLSYAILKKKQSWQLKNLNVVGISKWMNLRIKSSSLFKEAHLISIPNPIDLEIFKVKTKKQLKIKWGIEENSKYILFTAAIIDNYFKGFDLFLRVMQLIKQDSLDVTVLFAGEFKNYDLNSFPIPFIHLGKITNTLEMSEIFNIADIYISTSPNESFSYTVLEAACCGCYVVASDTGEIGEIINTTNFGAIVNENDEISYFEAIKTFLQSNRNFQNLYLNGLDKYGYEQVALSMTNAYNNQLDKQ
jgi:glycosyltransferase involved in cell wall biosynthesis